MKQEKTALVQISNTNRQQITRNNNNSIFIDAQLTSLQARNTDRTPKRLFPHLQLELWAVVNNAGILKGFSVDFSSVGDFRDCIDVNLLGSVRVTKAFLPLLRQTKGRIVNVTSIAGELSLPFFAPYIASKYAAVGFTDCLRFELDTWGISVVSIEPETFLTGLTCPETILKNFDAKFKGSFKEDYGDDYAAAFKDLANLALSFLCPKISIVVDDLEAAVSLEHPYHTYKPRRHFLGRFICFCYEVMPRSFQILLMKLLFFMFFSESKAIKDIVMKIASWI
ncbi:Estradiol 17-beta-dehydrogenase 2 [Araneus ventricosus]|uniref:Estradiol 17-beta-dehydrogenase 2 n=1 Tax=Araneus ventricosus TaxID=182803 RepID=A0A4Y2JZT6_ARAVE|nr:Estradiol 17-beta-dehydrogenase 2 [Araneus ventricosus]